LTGAIASFRKSIELDPKSAKAHCNLGNALRSQGNLPGAISSLHKAIELDPRFAVAHYNLGITRFSLEDPPGAIACFRKAIELDAMCAEAHHNMGVAFREQGELAAALAEFQKSHELGSKRRDWKYPSTQWVQQAKRLVELESQLPDLLSGQRKPANTAERLAFIEVCLYKQLHTAATRLYGEAFAADPKLSDDLKSGHRYNAACHAAHAGCGQGKDVYNLVNAERARLRRQALDWLRADLTLWAKQLETAKPDEKPAIAKTLHHWQQDKDLAAVRDTAALVKLPADERAAWQQLWADVAELLKKAEMK
jgi:tetratricopeptide (TPR) repeat protein